MLQPIELGLQGLKAAADKATRRVETSEFCTPNGSPVLPPRLIFLRIDAPPFEVVLIRKQHSQASMLAMGPVSLNGGYGSTHRSIEKGTRYGKATPVDSPVSVFA